MLIQRLNQMRKTALKMLHNKDQFVKFELGLEISTCFIANDIGFRSTENIEFGIAKNIDVALQKA